MLCSSHRWASFLPLAHFPALPSPLVFNEQTKQKELSSSLPKQTSGWIQPTDLLWGRKNKGMVMLPTWFPHFPVTEFFQGSWKLEQESNSPYGFSRHTDLQKKWCFKNRVYFCRVQEMNTHLIAANAVFFFLTIPTDKPGGLTLRQPWAGVLMHQWLKTNPTPFPVKATLALKAENTGWSSLGGKTVNLRASIFPFSLKKKSSMALSGHEYAPSSKKSYKLGIF